MIARNETEKTIMDTMTQLGYPESVRTTVVWATRKASDPLTAMVEVRNLLMGRPTGKEMTRAVQKYIR